LRPTAAAFWILDDITPLQQLTPSCATRARTSFHAASGLSVPEHRVGGQAPSIDLTAGQNPPYGASINYWLQSAPASDVKIQVMDRSARSAHDHNAARRRD